MGTQMSWPLSLIAPALPYLPLVSHALSPDEQSFLSGIGGGYDCLNTAAITCDGTIFGSELLEVALANKGITGTFPSLSYSLPKLVKLVVNRNRLRLFPCFDPSPILPPPT